MDERVEEARVDLHAPLREMGHDQRQRRNEVIAQLQFSLPDADLYVLHPSIQ